MTHSLLNRQLKRIGADKETLPSIEKWEDFLQRIERAYTDAEQERYLLERSLMISSQEMQELYEQLRKSETRYALASQGANDGLWDWDLVTEEIYYSQRWMEILGIVPEDGKVPCKSCWLDRIHPNDYAVVISEFDEHLRGQTSHFQNEHRVLHIDGEYRWVLIRGLAVKDEKGNACRIAGSLTDITERKLAEERLAHDAIHDALTGLPNRKNLMQRLARSLERLHHSEEYRFAIFFIDLDRFKTINDSLGHQAGDELLLKITQKLLNIIRPMDMVARLGGDEFVLLVENVMEKAQVVSIAERLLIELEQSHLICGQARRNTKRLTTLFVMPILRCIGRKRKEKRVLKCLTHRFIPARFLC
jgi:diguanylate cyclase (GGDEF)-like protein/PAS domain S-box-containing protein